MKRLKKCLSTFVFSFLILGVAGTSLLLSNNKPTLTTGIEDVVENDGLPTYFNAPKLKDNGIENVGENVYLVENNNSSFTLSILDETSVITRQTDDGEKSNFALVADGQENGKELEYTYFDFGNSISLYYNTSKSEAIADNGLDNLLGLADIGNYAKKHQNFSTITGISGIPQRFEIEFNLDRSKPFEYSTSGSSKVSLDKEGLYTLAIDVITHHTTNGGIDYLGSGSKHETIYYSFYIFNSQTYFDAISRTPLIETKNLSTANVSSPIYSKNYFYNYATEIPEFSYDKNKYQLTIEYTSYDDKKVAATIVCNESEIKFVSPLGNTIDGHEICKFFSLDGDNVVLNFNDLGSYEISFEFIYTAKETNKQYFVPMTKGSDKLDGTNSKFKSNNQRLYIYGYQTLHTDYDNNDALTGASSAKEFKTFNQDGSIKESADVTYLLPERLKSIKNAPVNLSTLKSEVWNEIKTLTPVKTNQPPVKFLTNANIISEEKYSKVFKLDENGELDEGKPFDGTNQNSSGTYVYVLQYRFDQLLSSSGAGQSTYANLQVLYFTIEDTTPVVSVKTNTAGQTAKDIYTKGFTNQSVVITDESSSSSFDATVRIILKASDFYGNELLNSDINLLSTSDNNDIFLSNNDGVRKVYIGNEGRYKNSKWVIETYTANSKQPNVKTFTIDTTEIGQIKARGVTSSTSSLYSISSDPISNNISNQSMIFSWNTKDSGASTYGYYKFFPIEEVNYYSKNSSSMLYDLLNIHKTLPVNAMLNLANGGDEGKNWIEYSNSVSYSSSVDASFVRASAGLYIFEVYDQAGNVGFETFLLDNTKPIFVQDEVNENGVHSFKIISTNNSLAINDNSYTIRWSENKGLYVKYGTNGLDGFVDGLGLQDQDKIAAGAASELEAKVREFAKTFIKTLSLTQVPDTSVDSDIASYRGDYVSVQINETYYVKGATDSRYQKASGYSYEIIFVDPDTQKEIEGSHQILLRDAANTKLPGETEYSFTNAPSAYTTINVTSDSSEMKVVYPKTVVDDEGEKLEQIEFTKAGFSLNGNFYENENGQLLYNRQSGSTESDKTYKFSYYSPVFSRENIKLSFLPVNGGSVVESIRMEYYPFIRNIDEVDENGNKPYEVTTAGKGNGYAVYYKLADKPTVDTQIFTFSNSEVYEGEKLIDISTTGSPTPLQGKYVFTRRYRTQDTAANPYDYFERKLTLIIDNENVISKRESVTKDGQTSAESVIGGDILLSMSSGEGQSNIEISFPNYNKDTGLNDGSFYTKSTFGDNKDTSENLTLYPVETNKLPLSLNIPKYKYTTFYQYVAATNSYNVFRYDGLSAFGGASLRQENGVYIVTIDGVEISFPTLEEATSFLDKTSTAEYELYAEITFVGNNGSIRLFKTDGRANNGGFLNIYEVNEFKDDIAASARPVSFTEAGTYTIVLEQASNQNVLEEANFKKFYKFGFIIESTSPEFDVLVNEVAIDNSVNIGNTETFWTNSKSLTFRWQDPQSQYMAKIDKNNISYRTLRGNSTSGDIKVGANDITDEGNGVFSWNFNFAEDWQQGDYVEVTMRFEDDRNDGLYSSTTKRVYVDYTAPTANLASLMSKVESATSGFFSRGYLERYARDLYDFAGNQLTELWTQANMTIDEIMRRTSYSYSQNDGTLKNYSYLVNSDFFDELAKSVDSNDNYNSKFIYYKKINDVTKYSQVTKGNFSKNSNDYYRIDEMPESEGYYEIVELDRAGNMVVYLVKLLSSEQDGTAIAYTNDRIGEGQEISLSDSDITENANIYSSSGFKIVKLDYLSDDWGFYISSYPTTRLFMRSPLLSNDKIYLVERVRGGELVFSEVELASVLNAGVSERKYTLNIANRALGEKVNIRISIANNGLEIDKGQDNDIPYIRMKVPTQAEIDSTSESHVFPTKIVISHYNGTSWTNGFAAENPSGNLAAWIAQSNEIYKFSLSSDGFLYIHVNTGLTSEKIRYEVTDNFGKTTTEFQIPNEKDCIEIQGSGYVDKIESAVGETTYISSKPITFSFNSKVYDVNVYKYNFVSNRFEKQTSNPFVKDDQIQYYIFGERNSFDELYKIEKFDSIEENGDGRTPVETLYIRIYNKLPRFSDNETLNESSSEIIFKDKTLKPISADRNTVLKTVEFDGKTFAAEANVITTFSSNVTLTFTDGQKFGGNYGQANEEYLKGYSYSLYIANITNDGVYSWTDISNSAGGYRVSGIGEYYILAKYDDEEVLTRECAIFWLQIRDASSVFYEVKVDGEQVEKRDILYTATDGDYKGQTFDTNYFVSVRYSDKDNRLNIVENNELGVKKELRATIQTGSEVVVEIYYFTSNSSAEGYFTIIYIPQSNSILSQIYYTNETGGREELIDKTSASVIVDKNKTTFSKLKLSWSSYYGIEENKVNIEISKLATSGYYERVELPIYTDKNSGTNYVNLTRAGSYQLRFVDSCKPENVHRFGGSDTMSLIFLSTAPFVVSYTDPMTNEELTTEPVQHAIYNGEVKLSLVDLNTYFTTAGYPEIHVTRNGSEYKNYKLENYVYTFSEAGYYKVSFSALDKTNSIAIREEEFVFTIINEKESMLSYEVTPYENYYIDRVWKYNVDINDKVDITDDLVAILGKNLVNVNNKEYLNRLLLSFSDEKTGGGRYIVTIKTGDNSYRPVDGQSPQIVADTFTFKIWINKAIPPISVSIEDGGSTNDSIRIVFSAENIYNAVGECYIMIGNSRFDINEETLANYGGGLTISEAGTYYIQVFTQSGVLLYSYKVTKGTPLNVWAIIAIVIGVIAAVVVTVITIKLRKKPKVK